MHAYRDFLRIVKVRCHDAETVLEHPHSHRRRHAALGEAHPAQANKVASRARAASSSSSGGGCSGWEAQLVCELLFAHCPSLKLNKNLSACHSHSCDLHFTHTLGNIRITLLQLFNKTNFISPSVQVAAN